MDFLHNIGVCQETRKKIKKKKVNGDAEYKDLRRQLLSNIVDFHIKFHTYHCCIVVWQNSKTKKKKNKLS